MHIHFKCGESVSINQKETDIEFHDKYIAHQND